MAPERSDLQAQLEEAGQRASHLGRQLMEREAECREMASLRRELENLHVLTQSQERRVAQSLREAQQSQVELASLEAILALLHLREVERHSVNIVICFPMPHDLQSFPTMFDLRNCYIIT